MDYVLRGGRVFDGSGAPPGSADVGVEDGRVIAVGEIGLAEQGKAEVVSLDGLSLAPGFIDVHTHYDAQVTWDPDLTPSCWHGVTTVVMGNCGFGIAPTRPADRGVIARILENVEGMSVEALEAGIDWSFETFPEYLDTLERLPKRLNVAAMIGHTPLRQYVLGSAATQRPATAEEIVAMRAIVGEALRAGAAGFATSKSPTHVGDGGQPVPSRLAELTEIESLAGVLGEEGRGVLQATMGPGLFLREFSRMSLATGRPVTWTALLAGMNGGGWSPRQLEKATDLGGEVWPQVACRPIVMQVTLADPFPFATAPAFQDILAVPRPERAAVYADAAWRSRARIDMEKTWGHAWSKITIQETEKHTELRNGPTLADLAAARGVDPLDLLVDLSLDEHLETRFRVVLANDDEDELATLLADPRTLLGLSDAGAHASQLCDACFSTHLLGHWVRERGVLPLEMAVWRLTGQAAHAFRLQDRGVLRPGAWADLVVFDPDTVGPTELTRVWDLPAGADRLIARSEGIEHVWVNGTAIRRDGEDLDGSHPGSLLRG